MNQRQIDEAQQKWIEGHARAHPPALHLGSRAHPPALHLGCGKKPIAGAVNVDPNPDRWGWVDVAADAHRLPFRDGCFGSVVSSHVLEHLHSPDVALQEAARVLRPGGVMGHVIPDHRFTPHRESRRHPFAQHHHEWNGPEDFEQVLNELEDLLDVAELQGFTAFAWSFKVKAVRL
jgi:SAM-dependent methyltransferase